jgi:hypothetical protein
MADFWSTMFGGKPRNVLDEYSDSSKALAEARNAKMIAGLNQIKLQYAPQMAQQSADKGAADVSIEQNKATYAPRMSAATLAGMNLTNQGKAIDNRYAPMIKQLEIHSKQIANAMDSQKFKDLPAQDQAAMHLQDAQTSLALAKAKALGGGPASKNKPIYSDPNTGEPLASNDPRAIPYQPSGISGTNTSAPDGGAAPSVASPSADTSGAIPMPSTQASAPMVTPMTAPSVPAAPIIAATNAALPLSKATQLISPQTVTRPPHASALAPPVDSIPAIASSQSVPPSAPNAAPMAMTSPQATAPAPDATPVISAKQAQINQTGKFSDASFPGADPKAPNRLEGVGMPTARGVYPAMYNPHTGEHFSVLTPQGRLQMQNQLISLHQAIPYIDDLKKYGTVGKFGPAGINQVLKNTWGGVPIDTAKKYVQALNLATDHVLTASKLQKTDLTTGMIHTILLRGNLESRQGYTDRMNAFQNHLRDLNKNSQRSLNLGAMSTDRFSDDDTKKYLDDQYNKAMRIDHDKNRPGQVYVQNSKGENGYISEGKWNSYDEKKRSQYKRLG